MKRGAVDQAITELQAELAGLDARRDRLTIAITTLEAVGGGGG